MLFCTAIDTTVAMTTNDATASTENSNDTSLLNSTVTASFGGMQCRNALMVKG